MEYINIKKGYKKEDLYKTAEIIKNGGIVIIPTDTVYGIASDSLNKKAVEKIYDLKNREFSKPCSVLVSSKEMIKSVTNNITEIDEKIIDKFFPGALTMIFKKNATIPEIVTSGLDTIGIRMPDNKFLLELIEIIGRPIVATSLNLAGETSKTNIDNIEKNIKNNVDLIVDAGETIIGKASTIIKIQNKEVKVLREGPISKMELEKEIN